MPGYFRDELGHRTSDTSQPEMESKMSELHEDEHTYRTPSSTSSSDTESNTSVTMDNGQTETSVTNAAHSDANRKNSAASEDEKMGFPVIKEADLDNESKITISLDDDGSSTTTSEDSGADRNGDTSPTQWDRPPPYEPEAPDKPKKPPPFEADPVRYILGMKLPIADSGFCACSHKTSTYATVFYITCYAALLIADACMYITPIIRMCFAYKFQLFLTKDEQHVLHAWTGILLLISAFVLWIGTYLRSRATLMVWLLVMLAYVLMSTVVWLLGLLLSFAADGWNTHSTAAISCGFIDIGLEFYLLHMVYSYNRYMHDKAPKIHYYDDPQEAARRQLELERLGFREVNIMGIPIVAPIAPLNDTNGRQGVQVTSV